MSLCPHCTKPLFRKSADGSALKAKTRVLILHKAGKLEFNCGACGKGVLMRITASSDKIQKAKPSARLVMPKRMPKI